MAIIGYKKIGGYSKFAPAVSVTFDSKKEQEAFANLMDKLIELVDSSKLD